MVNAVPDNYAVFFFDILIAPTVIMLPQLKKDEKSQKIDDLPVLATCQSGTSPMLSSEVNSPVAYRST